MKESSGAVEGRERGSSSEETREATPTSWGTNKRGVGWRALVVGTGDGAE